MSFTTINQKAETGGGIPAAPIASQSATTESEQLASLVRSFSWFQLSEQSHSTLSGLQGYYGRVIMNELDQPSPRQDKIDHWHAQMAKLAAIERDGNNFMTRERMEEIIIKYAPVLKLTS